MIILMIKEEVINDDSIFFPKCLHKIDNNLAKEPTAAKEIKQGITVKLIIY